MLLSLRKRLTVVLCPTHIAVAIAPPGWRPRPLAPALFACAPGGDSPWTAPLAALRHWLEQGKHGRASVDVIVSDSLARYALIPWSDAVRQRAEQTALARIHVETLFGSRAEKWHIHTAPGGYGQPSVACAVDAEFIAALRATLASHGLRLRSMQPYFMRAFNRWRARIQGNALFAVAESGQCVMATCKNGRWHSIRSVRLGEQREAELAHLIERETLLQGLQDTASIYLHSPEPKPIAVPATLTLLDAFSPLPGRVAALAMAMEGTI